MKAFAYSWSIIERKYVPTIVQATTTGRQINFNISGDERLGYWSQDTSHLSSHHCTVDDIYDDESLMENVYLGIKRPATLPISILEFIVLVIEVVTIEKVDIGHEIPDTIPIAIVDQVLMLVVEVDTGLRSSTLPPITQVVVVYFWVSHFLLVPLKKKFMVMKEVYIYIRPDTIPPITQVVVVDCWVYMFLLVLFAKVFMVMKELIVVVIMEDVYLGPKRPSTIPFKIMEKVLMVMVEFDIGLIPATLPPIIQVGLVDYPVSLFIVMIEVDIGLILDKFLSITMVDYTVST